MKYFCFQRWTWQRERGADLYIYRVVFRFTDFGYGALLSLLTIVFVVVAMVAANRFVQARRGGMKLDWRALLAYGLLLLGALATLLPFVWIS